MDITIIIAAIIGITEAAKRSGMSSKWAPLVSLALGIGASFAFITHPDVPSAILEGIILGLTAAGLYSGTKAVVLK